jgi:hypothetical protein
MIATYRLVYSPQLALCCLALLGCCCASSKSVAAGRGG